MEYTNIFYLPYNPLERSPNYHLYTHYMSFPPHFHLGKDTVRQQARTGSRQDNHSLPRTERRREERRKKRRGTYDKGIKGQGTKNWFMYFLSSLAAAAASAANVLYLHILGLSCSSSKGTSYRSSQWDPEAQQQLRYMCTDPQGEHTCLM